jgi:putative Mn2+ efflux pump MntP
MEIILNYIIPILICMDLFFLSITGGVTLQPYSWMNTLKITVVLSASLIISALVGHLLAWSLYPLIEAFASYAGYLLLAFLAVKMITDARKVKNVERTYLLEDAKILYAVALAVLFNTILGFLGLGLLKINLTTELLVIFGSAIIMSQIGLFLGSHYQPMRLGRYSKFGAGVLLLLLLILNYFI